MVIQRKGAYYIHRIFARFMHIWDRHMHAPQLYCLTFSAKPASGLGQSSTADQPWKVLTIRLVQWLGWVFKTKERKKEDARQRYDGTLQMVPHLHLIGRVRKHPKWQIWEFSLRWGWVFLERTRILSGIQFTTYFIEFFVVETKRFVSSFVHEILTRQTCGQRSSRAAESKRRGIGNYFSERICYMFPTSKCGGDWDPGLCTTSVLAFGEPQRNGNIRKKSVLT